MFCLEILKKNIVFNYTLIVTFTGGPAGIPPINLSFYPINYNIYSLENHPHYWARLNFGFVHLFDLILYVPSKIFQLNRDGSSWVEPVLS